MTLPCREVARIQDALVKARASGEGAGLLGPGAAKPDDPRRIERDLDQARAVADGQRTELAAMLEQAAQRIEGELEKVKVHDRRALVAELRADDHAVQQQVEAALRAVPAALVAWRAQEARHDAVMPEHLRPSRPIEDPQLDEVARAIRHRLTRPAPAPTPRAGIGHAPAQQGPPRQTTAALERMV